MGAFAIKTVKEQFPHHQFVGNLEQQIVRPIGLQEALLKPYPDSMTWITDQKSVVTSPENLEVGLLILSPEAFKKLKSAKANFLIATNPRLAFFEILSQYFGIQRNPGVEKTAVIHPSVVIGEDCYIGHHVVIERDCKIGHHTTILHNTTILEGTLIGNEVMIGCNNTIGNYGFGYEKDSEGQYMQLEHVGRVVIHDQVEIHNNTCIDRGVLGDTIIHENAKIDNLVHIAHGVIIGKNALVIANAMVAGSAVIGENSWIAPSVSIKNKAIIAPNTMTGIGAVVLKDTESNETYIGNPATTLDDYKQWSGVRKKLLESSSKEQKGS